ncbi:unnamed protein product [Adineta steineri]|uniref:N-acetyltransferase domain-containing protein n=2 Tax=Adineta steineri TaxID=433720 RepID=A0A814D6S5_9BILA|nr:unnamed protein product [Adineta steineri]
MNVNECVKDISHCLNVYNLTLCYSENNTWVENHSYCIFNEKIKPTCLCLPCFTGEKCEEEIVSRNLWTIFIPLDEVTIGAATTQAILGGLFGGFLILNGILCLQTYLCKKIRITNLGIYLIMLSFVSIFIGLLQIVFTSLIPYVKKLPQPSLFADFYCFIMSKFITVSLISMYNWFIANVAIERMLVECFTSYNLYDSRRRSFIVSTIIIIICPLTTLPGIFTVRQNQPPQLRPVQCINFTHLGYILYATITRIHLFAFYLLYIIMNIIVLGHLLRHRRRFTDNDSLPTQLWVILCKHKDFFIPYLIQALGQLPNIVMDFIMTCPMANTTLVARISVAFYVIQIAPFALTFYLYTYLSPVYWSEFWNSSPIGTCLIKMNFSVDLQHSKFPNLSISPMVTDDASEMFIHLNDEETVKYLIGPPFPITIDQIEDYISSRPSVNEYPTTFAIRDNKKMIGELCLIPRKIASTYELGYYLARPYWNNGITTAAVKTFLNIMIERISTEHDIRIEAGYLADNLASENVLKKCGFTKTGCEVKMKNGQMFPAVKMARVITGKDQRTN